MHSVLLIIEKPTDVVILAGQAWLDIQATIDNHINNDTDIHGNLTKKVGDNVLLLVLPQSFPFSVSLLSKIQDAGFSYQVLFFEEEPQWIQYSPPQQ